MKIVSMETLKKKVILALEILKEVVMSIELDTIVQTVSTPEPPKKVKKAGKKAGRPRGSKNKTAEASPPAAPTDTYMGKS